MFNTRAPNHGTQRTTAYTRGRCGEERWVPLKDPSDPIGPNASFMGNRFALSNPWQHTDSPSYFWPRPSSLQQSRQALCCVAPLAKFVVDRVAL